MRMLLKKLECDTYLSLVAASSIIRPGVAQSGMMRAYIERYRDPSKRVYLHPKMGELMEETYGVMVYQEDVIKVAHHFAGLTLAESDVLRRGMSGKFRGRDEFQKAEKSFIDGCKAKGYSDYVTNEAWRQVESFAGYSFSKGHSASYAVESYQSLFLKAYFPLEFMVGVINNFGGFFKTEFYVHEARMAGANIQAPCINMSEHLTCIYDKDLYLGFIHMAELEQRTSEQVLKERSVRGKFIDLADFIERVPISREQLRIFIRIGAFRFTGKTKKELLWEMFALMGDKKLIQADDKLFHEPAATFTLPTLSYNPIEDAHDEIEVLGFPLCSPFTLLVNELKNDIKAKDLMNILNTEVEIAAYLVCIKYTRTKNGKDMMFATFLDQDGHFFDTTHFPPVCDQYPFTGRGCYMIKGKVVEEFGFPSIEVTAMERLAVKQRL
jgi:DNA polymerase-3 subunit alpha